MWLPLDGSKVNLLIAFLGGIFTFFASCLLPLVPTYLAVLSGFAFTKTGEATKQRWPLLRLATVFVSGFILTFITLGLLLGRFALLLGPYRLWLERLGGLVFLAMGLFLLGVGKKTWLQREWRITLSEKWLRWRIWHAFLAGLAFGFGWTPCIGPILAVILFWSARQETMFLGTSLLLAYGLGLGLPFLVVAAAFESITPWLHRAQRLSQIIKYVSAVVIILAGILMLLNQSQSLSLWLLHLLQIDAFTSQNIPLLTWSQFS